MAYTAPGTAVAGDVLTAAFWNQQVRDNITELAGAPFARNILYNGAIQVAQRGTSPASITTSGYYTADRWYTLLATLGTWTQSVENDAPTGSGFRKSAKMLCTTADASPASGDYLLFRQLLEGQDVQRIAKGTSSAQTLTVSFWVKANVTGTFIVELEDEDNARSVSQAYTISASATWERKTITFPADTTGALDNDNAASLILNFWLASGSSFSSGTLQTTWNTRTNANRNVGGTNLASAINNYWQITGVQLETGSVATGFEFLTYGDDLRRCQRYFQTVTPSSDANIAVGVGAATSATNAFIPVPLCTQMRSTPLGTISAAASFSIGYWSGGNIACTALARNGTGSNPNLLFLVATVASGLTTNAGVHLYRPGTTAYIWADAEL